jgi:hypothetical protein
MTWHSIMPFPSTRLCDPIQPEPMIVPPVWNKTHYHHSLAAV